MKSLDHLAAHEREFELNGKSYVAKAPTIAMFAQITKIIREHMLSASDQAARMQSMAEPQRMDLWRRVATTELTGEEIMQSMTRPEIAAHVMFLMCRESDRKLRPETFLNCPISEMARMNEIIMDLFETIFGRETNKEGEDGDRPTEKSGAGRTKSRSSSSTTDSATVTS